MSENLVPPETKCVFCGRHPKPDETYGREEKDWDKPGTICPECWDKTFSDFEEDYDPETDTDAYSWDRYPGVAFRVRSWEKVWDTYSYLEEDPETGEEVEIVDNEGEWIDCPDRDRVVVRMVGDDRDFVAPLEELVRLEDDALCWSCGQIGCGCNPR